MKKIIILALILIPLASFAQNSEETTQLSYKYVYRKAPGKPSSFFKSTNVIVLNYGEHKGVKVFFNNGDEIIYWREEDIREEAKWQMALTSTEEKLKDGSVVRKGVVFTVFNRGETMIYIDDDNYMVMTNKHDFKYINLFK